jgi:hypothetical protein
MMGLYFPLGQGEEGPGIESRAKSGQSDVMVCFVQFYTQGA